MEIPDRGYFEYPQPSSPPSRFITCQAPRHSCMPTCRQQRPCGEGESAPATQKPSRALRLDKQVAHGSIRVTGIPVSTLRNLRYIRRGPKRLGLRYASAVRYALKRIGRTGNHDRSTFSLYHSHRIGCTGFSDRCGRVWRRLTVHFFAKDGPPGCTVDSGTR